MLSTYYEVVDFLAIELMFDDKPRIGLDNVGDELQPDCCSVTSMRQRADGSGWKRTEADGSGWKRMEADDTGKGWKWKWKEMEVEVEGNGSGWKWKWKWMKVEWKWMQANGWTSTTPRA
jgi:hypothetical protein